jgi:hypothetical protein
LAIYQLSRKILDKMSSPHPEPPDSTPESPRLRSTRKLGPTQTLKLIAIVFMATILLTLVFICGISLAFA